MLGTVFPLSVVEVMLNKRCTAPVSWFLGFVSVGGYRKPAFAFLVEHSSRDVIGPRGLGSTTSHTGTTSDNDIRCVPPRSFVSHRAAEVPRYRKLGSTAHTFRLSGRLQGHRDEITKTPVSLLQS